MHVQTNAGELKIDIPQDLRHALFCVLFAYVNSRLLHPIALVLHGPRRLRNFQLLGPVSWQFQLSTLGPSLTLPNTGCYTEHDSGIWALEITFHTMHSHMVNHCNTEKWVMPLIRMLRTTGRRLTWNIPRGGAHWTWTTTSALCHIDTWNCWWGETCASIRDTGGYQMSQSIDGLLSPFSVIA